MRTIPFHSRVLILPYIHVSIIAGSGYTVKVSVLAVDVRPMYESVDHSAGNDLGYAPQEHTKLCSYPVPEYYTLSVQLHKVQQIIPITRTQSCIYIYPVYISRV